MEKRNRITLLYIWLFTVSISMTVIPSGIINTYGLLGEIKAAVICENRSAVKHLIEARKLTEKMHRKGVNVYNYWFISLMIILYIRFSSYVFRLPPSNTIVSLKVRLDN